MIVRALVRQIRPRQWLKNLFCLGPLFFSGKFQQPNYPLLSLQATLAFCFLSSVVYIINDLRDLPLDREHPTKRMRPLAAGLVQPWQAIVVAVGLLAASIALTGSLPGGGWLPFVYVTLNLAYSLGLKHEPVLEMLIVASGFPIRAAFGTLAILEPLSPWMLNSSFFLALFIAAGKRYGELKRVAGLESHSRPVLGMYSAGFLEATLYSTAVMACISYGLFTTRPGAPVGYLVTIPIVLYCIFHYLRRMLVEGVGEEPERVLLADRRLQIGVSVWIVLYLAAMLGGSH